MIYSSKALNIKLNTNFNKKCLHFEFKGKFTNEASKEGVRVWSEEFNKADKNVKHIIIWDCIKMTGFEPSAKKEWKKYLDENHDKIACVIMISGNIILRGAAHLLLRFLPCQSKVVKSLHEATALFPEKVSLKSKSKVMV